MKKILFIGGALVFFVVGVVFFMKSEKPDVFESGFNPKNTTYNISGEPIMLIDGVFRKSITPNSSSTITVRYFGNEAYGDIDGDGDEDVSFLLTQDGGGSGIFFYLVAALKDGDRYQGSQAMLIGDRISPQTTLYQEGLVVVNYADRKPGEAMAMVPSVAKSLYAKYSKETNSFGEVVRNFEGEADSARMDLTMKTWQWINASYNDGRMLVPKQDVFTLTFKKDGTFSARTDCNGVGGVYRIQKNMISFHDMVSTLMYCEGSQEQDFITLLNHAFEYHFTSKGELILGLKFDSGTMMFR